MSLGGVFINYCIQECVFHWLILFSSEITEFSLYEITFSQTNFNSRINVTGKFIIPKVFVT